MLGHAGLCADQDAGTSGGNPRPVAVYSLRASALLNAFWVPLAFQEAALLAIAVPAKLLQLAPATYTSALAGIASLSAAVSMIAPPIAGTISDHLRRTRGGTRKTIIVTGAIFDVVCLLLAARSTTAFEFGASFVASILGASTAIAAYQALLPDMVPRRAWGAVSGMRGAANLVGTVIGLGIAASMNPDVTLVATSGFIALGTLSVYAIRPHPHTATDHEERARVRDWHDFIIAFIARLFVAFGLSLLMTFALYFFHDVVHAQNAQAGTGLVAGFALLGAIASTIFLGKLSDLVMRKWIVALCGIPMALAAFGFAVFPNMHAVYAFALLFGVGYGGVFSSAWALAIDAIPQLRDVARDLGIWGLASNIPGVIAPAAGGWILAWLGSTLFAYQVLFFAAACSFAIGSGVVLAIRGPQPAPRSQEFALSHTTSAFGGDES
jgi:MFS family permease